MNHPTRTNPEYAAMAYRKALLSECVSFLKSYTALMGGEPKGKIVSEDVVRDDSEVPQEEILEFITGLQQESEGLRLEMAKFDFVKREVDDQRKRTATDKEGDGAGNQEAGAKAKPKRSRRVRAS